MRSIGLALWLLALTACAPDQEWRRPPGETERASCRASDGEYRQVGMLGTWACVIDYPDGGRPCADSDQCAGRCVYVDQDHLPDDGDEIVGACEQNNALFGCFSEVEDGQATQAICVD